MRNPAKTFVATLADNLKDIPLLFPPLKYLAVEIASFGGLVNFTVADMASDLRFTCLSLHFSRAHVTSFDDAPLGRYRCWIVPFGSTS
jgi:hypothetical protein